MTAQEVGEKSIAIAADICVYTNHTTVVETIPQTKAPRKVSTEFSSLCGHDVCGGRHLECVDAGQFSPKTMPVDRVKGIGRMA